MKKDVLIKDLRSLVLSFDQERKATTMEKFSLEVSRLKEMWEQDVILHIFLQILHAVGKYIKANKAKDHADSIGLLHSTINVLERVVSTPDMTPETKKKLANEELKKFYALKKRLVQSSSGIEKAELKRNKTAQNKSLPPQHDAVRLSSGTGTTLDDLYKGAPSSPVDELLTEIHAKILDGNSEESGENVFEPEEVVGKTESPGDTRKIVPHRPPNVSSGEINRQLNNFFGDDKNHGDTALCEHDAVVLYRPNEEENPEAEKPKETVRDGDDQFIEGSLHLLRSLFKALDSDAEIRAMTRFGDEIRAIKKRHHTPHHLILIQLLESLGKHVHLLGTSARPDSEQLVESVSNCLNEITTNDMSESAAQERIYKEISRYIEFQDRLLSVKASEGLQDGKSREKEGIHVSSHRLGPDYSQTSSERAYDNDHSSSPPPEKELRPSGFWKKLNKKLTMHLP